MATSYTDWLTETWKVGGSFPPNLIRGLRTIFPELSYDDAVKIYKAWYQSYKEDFMAPSQFSFKQQVNTSLGPGRINARGADDDTYLVDFFPEWFTPEQWNQTFGVAIEKVGTGLNRFIPASNITALQPGETHPRRYNRGMLQSPIQQPAVQPIKKGTNMTTKKSTPLPDGEFEPGADVAPKATKAPIKMIDAYVGLKVATNKKGDRYEVVVIDHSGITLSWLDGKYKRVVTAEQLSKGYTVIPEDAEETEN